MATHRDEGDTLQGTTGEGASASPDAAIVAAYTTKQVTFRFEGAELGFCLSHGLFSSSDIDSGTRFLLKELSLFRASSLFTAGSDPESQKPLRLLDAGSGIGVIGIALGRAIRDRALCPVEVRSEDRDELARAFTSINARNNGLSCGELTACAEKLLAPAAGGGWNLIVSNLPAKAGTSVLRDFFIRAPSLLAPGGLIAVVIVNPLSQAARGWIMESTLTVEREAEGKEHTVFILSPAPGKHPVSPEASRENTYLRTASTFTLEGVSYDIEAVHGSGSFDSIATPARLAAKLLNKLSLADSPRIHKILLQEDDQGHLASWIGSHVRDGGRDLESLVLSGRIVLSLEGGVQNARRANPSIAAKALPLVDLALGGEALLTEGPFDLIVAFPEKVPLVDRAASVWAALPGLLSPGGVFLLADTSTEAERFEKRKSRGMTRLSELKKDGFRAVAWRLC